MEMIHKNPIKTVACASLCSLCLLLMSLACDPSSAGAVTTLPYLTKFETPIPANQEEVQPEISGGVGVYGATHELYVGDPNNHRVLRFGGLGAFTEAFGSGVNLTTGGPVCTEASDNQCGRGTSSIGPGGFVDEGGVAVDQDSGDVYVPDYYYARVQKFNADGEFLLMFGKGVNKDGGDVCSASEAANCQGGVQLEAGEGGEGFHGWVGANGEMGHVAVGSSGTVYVGDEDRVEKFSAEGVYEGEVALPGTGIDYGLAVDGAGDLYVAASNTSGANLTEGVTEYSPAGVKIKSFGSASGDPLDAAVQEGSNDVFILEGASERVSEYSPAGVLEAQSPVGALPRSEYPTDGALAVTSEGTVYVTNGTRELAQKTSPNGTPSKKLEGERGVVVFGSPPSIPPSVSHEDVTGSGLGVRSVEVEADVNPDLHASTFKVEYGLTEGYGETVEGGVVGEDLAEHRVVVKLSGLEPGLTYHYRVVAQSTAGIAYGADDVFTTYPSPLLGLPDGRVYELVSEAVKYGHQAGTTTAKKDPEYALARTDGSAVLYGANVGEGVTQTGLETFAVARDGEDGWSSSSAVPQGHTPVGDPAEAQVAYIVPSSNLERIVFEKEARSFYASPEAHPVTHEDDLYRALTNGGLSEPEWLSEPGIARPLPEAGVNLFPTMVIVGGSPDLGTVFFGYTGTLVREDSSRATHVGTGAEDHKPWGFYESSGGAGEGSKLSSAGILPSTGKASPWGAAPASIAGTLNNYGRELVLDPATADNDVAMDGSRADALFVSPDPNSVGLCEIEEAGTGQSAEKVKEVCTPQLYLREGTERTVLVSRSMLSGGQAADGPLAVAAASISENQERAEGYGFQSADGSKVFFQSADRLTGDAPENGEPKEYVFDVATEAVSYLPGVVGAVVAASGDGSRVVFLEATSEAENVSKESYPLTGRLVLWDEGSTSVVASVPAPASGMLDVNAGRVVGSGPEVVFQSDSALSRSGGEALNDGGGFQQVFRWTPSEGLSCVSCAPWGVAPSGSAYLSRDTQMAGFLVENDGVSEDGSEIFFDTPSPLVASDVNGVSDVYEWENGHVYLISGGRSPYPSFFLDSSADGGDVFFTTAESLVPGDTDGGDDVYDARVGGRTPVEPEAACTDGCRGAGESTPGPLTGLTGVSGPSGNLLAAPAPVSVASGSSGGVVKGKALTRSEKLAAALSTCKRKRGHARASCEKSARKRYGPTTRKDGSRAKKSVKRVARGGGR